jgi:UDP-N-acetylmuramoyl-tripeptide--D-alanyl-D-alanine ligase
VLAVVRAAGADVLRAAEALSRLEPLPGRGRRCELAWRGGTLTLIDESYNASPAAMRAALAVLGATEPGPSGRRIAVLGDMLELGSSAEQFHRELAEPVAAAKVDRVFLVGAAMSALFETLPEETRGGYWQSSEEAIPALLQFLEPGDVVTIKGSRGVCVSDIVERLCAEAGRQEI